MSGGLKRVFAQIRKRQYQSISRREKAVSVKEAYPVGPSHGGKNHPEDSREAIQGYGGKAVKHFGKIPSKFHLAACSKTSPLLRQSVVRSEVGAIFPERLGRACLPSTMVFPKSLRHRRSKCVIKLSVLSSFGRHRLEVPRNCPTVFLGSHFTELSAQR
jgi:hypothetical protein